MYRCVDAAVVRAATRTSGLDVAPWPDLTGGTGEQVAQWRCWLERVWAQDAFAAAVEVASPVLAHCVGEVCAGHEQRARQVRRAVVSVVRYLLRTTSRATPFGLFAGVAPARFGFELAARYGEDHHAVARVGGEWLAAVITRLEGRSELRRRLPVVLNNLCFVRDGRLVVGCQQQPAESSRTAPVEVSVRHTRAVETVMQAARSPVRVCDLVGKLTAAFPRTTESVIEGMLAELMAQRILITSLHPPMTATDPLADVVAELTAVRAEQVPQAALLLQQLREIHAELSRHNRVPSPATGRDSRTSAARKMAAISTSEQPLTVDLRVDCAVVLPPAVAREAETAAAALARLTPYPYGPPAWRDYHNRFLERYGIGAVVPVSEILNADTGLGFPAGYRDSCLELPTAPLSERDTRLLALAQNAAMDRSIEVVLDEQGLSDLMAEDFAAAQVQPHTEVCFRVHAPTRDALDRGEFDLAVVGVSRAAGTMTGRFLDLLDPADRERVLGAYARLPTVNDDALPVQMSCPPLYPRTENVARSPAVLPHVISLAEHHTGGGRVPLDDLAVSGDAQRLYLMSLSKGRPVEPTVFSAVEFTNAAHPLLRFLCEISTARAAACAPFSWGAASRLPFLPRVRYGRTILSPARWILAAADLPGRNAPWPEWVESLAEWRCRYRVPDAVYLGEDDRRIRLDLDEPAHLHLLWSDVDRAGHATLREAPDTSAFGWLDGRAHEIVVPLAATSRPVRSFVPRRASCVRRTGPEHGHLPGTSEWLFVKLYGRPDRHTAVLTTHLPGLLSEWDEPPQWWFLPYQDPEPHLRLRFRLPDVDAFGETAQRVGAWAAGLRRLGLIGHVQFDTYYPETGRFGEGAAMTAAESVFAADSAATIAQRTHTASSGAPHQQALTAASLVDLTTTLMGGVGDGMRWLIDHIDQIPTPASAREVYDQAIHLANPRDQWAALRAIPGGEHIANAWARRRTALAAYRETITATDEITLDSVLPALLHLQHVRMAGIAPDTERACHRLARAAALSWTAQTKGREAT
ncbi:MAG: lantibiotic dehydratase [Pseudonocardiaceae bacterium]|nr:lantibiotic dehydratase [Pseudonocardiaceae bacterium]